MADSNTIIKDGVGNAFSLRSKDLTSDGALRRSMVYATPYPVDYGNGGAYQTKIAASSMAAGLAANAPIFMFRFVNPSLVALVRRVKIGAWSLGTGFAAGIATFNMFVARNFTVEDSGGLGAGIASNTAKLRTNMQPATAVVRYSDTATLTAGSRTLDALPIDSLALGVPTTTFTSVLTRTDLFSVEPGEHPLTLATNEGFIIQATVPATGVWAYKTSVEWEECPYY